MLLSSWSGFVIATFIFNLTMTTVVNAEGLTIQGINETVVSEFEKKITEAECKGGNFLLNIEKSMFDKNISIGYLTILLITAFIFYKLGRRQI